VADPREPIEGPMAAMAAIKIKPVFTVFILGV
jgi:hypothetical protein